MDSNLYNTVAKDDVVVLREIEGGGLTVADQLTPTKSTVLHLACQYGSFSCVEHILETHQSLLLKINSRGETALHLAAKQGNIGVVGALLSSARFLDQQQNNPQNSTVVQALIRTPDKELETALHGAVRYNRNDVVGLLVGEDPRHVHPQNKHNESPLYLASIRCYADIIRTIFNKCEWPDIGSAEGRRVLHAMFGGPEGRTALHAALLDEGGLACVKVLLNKNKALTKVVDNYGWTAYHYVAYNNLDTIVEALVGDGADKSVAYLQDNEYKRTALHVAACKGNLRVLKKLIEYFPDSWEIEDGSGRNIFHIAVEQNRKEVIDFIMSRGFETSNNLMTKRDNNGNTPLHMIAKLGCYVPQLMGQTWDVDWEVLDSKNLTPLDVLHSEQEKHTLADQLMVRQSLIKAKVKKHWRLWRTLKEPDAEFGRRIVKHSEKTNNEQVEECWKAINSHMIACQLELIVFLTAAMNFCSVIAMMVAFSTRTYAVVTSYSDLEP
ncbi:hypothetical protein POM88_000893 [Heracleum sosnowskyi]|uniref:Uncharacterized protein n=1 Tax=Heracleum sosnowskyi TaxID=360622 RepID=A0AAD8JCF6_9APIA|nr:hypothetical protein POM88_000893 [Heracleum sosnowskyi]